MECESTSSNMLAFRIQNNRTWFLPLKTLLLIIRVICVQIIELGKDCKGDVNKWLYKIKKKNKKELISLKVLGKVSWGRSHCSTVWKNEDICTKERCFWSFLGASPGWYANVKAVSCAWWMYSPRLQMLGKVTALYVSHTKLAWKGINIVRSKKQMDFDYKWTLEEDKSRLCNI